MDLHEKEKMYQRLIVFTLLIGMVIYYFEKIMALSQQMVDFDEK